MTRHRSSALLAVLLLTTARCDDEATVVNPGGPGGSAAGGSAAGGSAAGGTGTAGTSAGAGGSPGAGSAPSVSLALVASGLVSPVALRATADNSRLFIAEQTGVIRVIESGRLSPAPVLDITDRLLAINPPDDERGLIGLALHPDFASNGRAFIHYSAPLRTGAPDGFDHTNVISEVRLDAADGGASERIVLALDHPRSNHNGGAIVFGPDGHLYIGFGDGGGGNDVGIGHVADWYDVNEGGNGQDRTSNLLGSILRIDVNGAQPYAIPADNPFADSPMPEVWAYGFRNPFQFSFDRGGTRQLFAGDVGQNQWEEVDIVTAGSNYGWNVKEGTHCFSTASPSEGLADCPSADPEGVPLVDPIIEYAGIRREGGLGVSVIGGHVYRGTALPELVGKYIFGDWSTTYRMPDGHLFVASPPADGAGLWSMVPLAIANRDGGNLGEFVLGLGEDAAGELYVLTSAVAGPSGTSGKVYRIEP